MYFIGGSLSDSGSVVMRTRPGIKTNIWPAFERRGADFLASDAPVSSESRVFLTAHCSYDYPDQTLNLTATKDMLSVNHIANTGLFSPKRSETSLSSLESVDRVVRQLVSLSKSSISS